MLHENARKKNQEFLKEEQESCNSIKIQLWFYEGLDWWLHYMQQQQQVENDTGNKEHEDEFLAFLAAGDSSIIA